MSEVPLARIEDITRTMLETATQEDWERLARLESERLVLLRGLDRARTRSAEEQATLARIIENNALLTQRVQDRRNEIGDLLNGLAGHPRVN